MNCNDNSCNIASPSCAAVGQRAPLSQTFMRHFADVPSLEFERGEIDSCIDERTHVELMHDLLMHGGNCDARIVPHLVRLQGHDQLVQEIVQRALDTDLTQRQVIVSRPRTPCGSTMRLRVALHDAVRQLRRDGKDALGSFFACDHEEFVDDVMLRLTKSMSANPSMRVIVVVDPGAPRDGGAHVLQVMWGHAYFLTHARLTIVTLITHDSSQGPADWYGGRQLNLESRLTPADVAQLDQLRERIIEHRRVHSMLDGETGATTTTEQSILNTRHDDTTDVIQRSGGRKRPAGTAFLRDGYRDVEPVLEQLHVFFHERFATGMERLRLLYKNKFNNSKCLGWSSPGRRKLARRVQSADKSESALPLVLLQVALMLVAEPARTMDDAQFIFQFASLLLSLLEGSHFLMECNVNEVRMMMLMLFPDMPGTPPIRWVLGDWFRCFFRGITTKPMVTLAYGGPVAAQVAICVANVLSSVQQGRDNESSNSSDVLHSLHSAIWESQRWCSSLAVKARELGDVDGDVQFSAAPSYIFLKQTISEEKPNCCRPVPAATNTDGEQLMRVAVTIKGGDAVIHCGNNSALAAQLAKSRAASIIFSRRGDCLQTLRAHEGHEIEVHLAVLADGSLRAYFAGGRCNTPNCAEASLPVIDIVRHKQLHEPDDINRTDHAQRGTSISGAAEAAVSSASQQQKPVNKLTDGGFKVVKRKRK